MGNRVGLGAATALALLLATGPVGAHPLGNFSISRYAAIGVEPEAIEIRYLVDMAEIPTFQEMQEFGLAAQADHPGTAAYLVRQAEALGRGLRLHADGRALALRVQSRQVSFTPGAADLPTMKLAFVYRAALEPAAVHRLSYRDENFGDRLGWREVVARAAPGMALAASTVPERDRSRELSDYPAHLLDSPPQVAEADILVERATIAGVGGADAAPRPTGLAGLPAVAAAPDASRRPDPAAVAPGASRRPDPAAAAPEASRRPDPAAAAPEASRRPDPAAAAAGVGRAPEHRPVRVDRPVEVDEPSSRLTAVLPEPGSGRPAQDPAAAAMAGGTPPPSLAVGALARGGSSGALADLMTRRDMGPGLLLFTLATAVVLGAFHALEPGHGKTVVGAYLVGSKGTAWHAVLLGLGVTISHTAGVFLLGAVTLYASRYAMPERLYPWLGAISGMAIAAVGLGLLRRHWRGQPNHHGHDHGHAHPHTHHGHVHAHPDSHTHHEHGHSHPDSHTHHEHSHGHSLTHHEHADGHPHPHGAGHGQAHAAVHGSSRGHGGHHHHPHVPGGPVSVRSLLALSVSGGIVPCPGALVVLLSALAWRRVGLGMLLVVAFSVGLAAVLVAIGVLMVHARRLLGRARGEGPLVTRWLPLASSAVVTVLGVLIAVQALRGAGMLALRGLSAGG